MSTVRVRSATSALREGKIPPTTVAEMSSHTATVGLHPHEATAGVETITDLLATPGIVAIGEAGLDYYYDHAPREAQRDAFAAQIQLAHVHGLPLVIHSRDAWSDTFDILAAEGTPTRTIFHCFTGGPDEIQRCLDLGAFVSFSGIVTFKSAADVYQQRTGVCRDFNHLALTFCRCLGIPARYATGYLGDIGVPASPSPMDFSGWFEAYLDGRWFTFDARNNTPRIGRVLMARGRDAVDVAITTSFGPTHLEKFSVYTDQV